ncbi:MAG: acyl-ACP--UDP-N-acetylglucosamine O-acyltransferase [bacterium]|nr:acyl-ACP--UDP-N-acetylglucosamine O-acyltransferase [bacterium]
MSSIHPTAIVDSAAQIAADVTIGPYTIVESGVRIGEGCRIGAHVTLAEGLRLGRRVRVYNYACLGTASQDLKHRGEPSGAEIGDNAIVREFVTVNRGTRAEGITRVGPRVVLMSYCHVAHECVVEPDAILVNNATLGGEVTVGRGAMIGGLVGVHQFCRIGAYAIVGACSKVTLDVAPFLVADGHPARPYRPNVVGLRRHAFSDAQIRRIHRIYRELFDVNRSFDLNLAIIERMAEGCDLAADVLDFCRASRRGLARPRPRGLRDAALAVDYDVDAPQFHLL